MNTRDLVIKIPEPLDNGMCQHRCPLFTCCPSKMHKMASGVYGKDRHFPGPGCPWFKLEEAEVFESCFERLL